MAKNAEKTGGIVGPVLLAILATVGISAGGYGAGIGVGILRYEVIGPPFGAQEQGQPSGAPEAQSVVPDSTAGPTVRVESGVVTWRIEDEQSSRTQAPAQVPASGTQGSQTTATAPTQTQDQPQPPAQSQPPAQKQNTTPATKNNTNSATSENTAKPQGGNAQSEVNNGNSGSNQTSNLDWPEGKYLASKNGKKYHRTYCEKGMTGAVNIKEENKIWFDSEEAAKATGRTRCDNCW